MSNVTKKHSQPRRASQRTAVSINLAENSLRQLMTEQCRDGDYYITVYHGSRAELTAAGVPDAAFPTNEQDVAAFRVQTLNACCTGSRELLNGSMRRAGTEYELEIEWGSVRPYVQCSHPAISELARMISMDVGAWAPDMPDDLEHPIRMLADDPRSDYQPGVNTPRLRVTPEFVNELESYRSSLYQMVHSYCEVLPSTQAQQPRRPTLRLISSQN